MTKKNRARNKGGQKMGILGRMFKGKRRWFSMGGIAVIIAVLLLTVLPQAEIHLPPLTIGGDEITLTIGVEKVYAAGTPDYTCDGVDDNVQLQQALDALPSGGGKLVILSGQYNLSATPTRAINNVVIQGSGDATYITYNASSPVFTAGGNDWEFRNFRTDAGGVSTGSTTGWVVSDVKVSTTVVGLTVRSATFVVAASNTSQTNKAQADFVCDGTADDVQIQAAIDALPTNGGSIVFTDGDFYCDDRIYPDQTQAQVFQGQGSATILHWDNGDVSDNFFFGRYASAETLSNITFRDFKVIDDGTPAESFGIVTGQTGASTTCTNIYVENIEFEECGLHYHNVTDGHIIGCFFHDITTIGTCRIGASYNIAVISNVIEDVYGMGISSSGQNIVIANNLLDNTDTGGLGAYAIDTSTTVDVRVDSNIISNSTGGILSENGDGSIAITNNTFTGDGVGTGKAYEVYRTAVGQPQADVIIISGNTADTCESPLWIHDEDVALVDGNLFYNCNNGINIAKDGGWGVEPTKIVISNNVMIDVCMVAYNCAVYGGSLTTVTVENNRIFGNDTATALGVGYLGAGSRCVYNEIDGYTAYAVYECASAEVFGNIGWVTENTGTATVANGTTSIAVNHGLSETPTRVIVTPAEDPTNPVTYWWVDTLGASQFTIHVDADPGASNLDFHWQAVVD